MSTHFDKLTRKKSRSGTELRERLLAWCLEQGGSIEAQSAPNSVTGGVLGGTVRLPLPTGSLLVFLPSDSNVGLCINARFVDDAPLPGDANPYSGKWNFAHFAITPAEDDALFQAFTRRFLAYRATVLPTCKTPVVG